MQALYTCYLTQKSQLFWSASDIINFTHSPAGAQWLSGRVLDTRPRGRGFEPWSSGSPSVQQSGTICAILVEGVMTNNSVKLL